MSDLLETEPIIGPLFNCHKLYIEHNLQGVFLTINFLPRFYYNSFASETETLGQPTFSYIP